MQISSRESDVLHGDIYTSEFYEEIQIYDEMLDTPNEASDFNKGKSLTKRNDIFKNRKTEKRSPSLIKINETNTTNIDLPSIIWHGYNAAPKFMYITNTGRTILINGQWSGNRPYIEGGPLNGTYQFSQVHFHSPSEHEVNGKRYPLEMHVVHYKSCYLTQEKAMHEKDGTVVLVYLFQVMEEGETPISSLVELAPKIEKVNSQIETKNLTLDQFVKPFSSKYFVYWGSVSTEKNSYLLQWIVHCDNLCVTRKEVDDLLSIINFREMGGSHIPRLKPENDVIYYVEENEEFDNQKEAEKHEEFLKQEESNLKEHNHCSTCHLIYEWWAQYCENSAKPVEIHSKGTSISGSIEMQKESEKVCRTCGHKKIDDRICDSVASESSSCVSSRKRKSKRKKKVDIYSSETESQSSVSEKESRKKKKRSFAENTQSSCPSFSQDVAEGECTDSRDPCAPKATSSCPSATISSVSISCQSADKKRSSFKKSCDELKATISCVYSSMKKEKNKDKEKGKGKGKEKEKEKEKEKKKEKKKEKEKEKEKEKVKENEKEKEKEMDNEKQMDKEKKTDKEKKEHKEKKRKTSNKRKAVKKKSKDSNRKDSDHGDSDRRDSDRRESERSDSEYSNSRSSIDKRSERSRKKSKTKIEKSKDSEKRDSKTNNEEQEEDSRIESCELKIPISVQCSHMTQSSPSASFNTILREFDNLMENKNKVESSNHSSKTPASDGSCPSRTSENKVEEELHLGCNDDIKTLFEKKKEISEVIESTNKPTSVNYLLTSVDDQFSQSSGIISSSQEEGNEKKTSDISFLLNPEDLVWSGVDVSAVNLPSDNPMHKKNELCVQMELLFHSSNSVFSGSSAQEYDLALLYNQKVLQEYKGILYPDKLEVGHYRKLELFPKYPELGGLSVHLEDCTVKLETPDQLCMRAKFLLKEHLDGITSEIIENMSENPPKARLTLNDAVTQCSLKKCADKEIDCIIEAEVESVVDKDPQVNVEKKCSERYPKRIAFPDFQSDESDKDKVVDEIILKAGTSECKIRLDPNPDVVLEQNRKNQELESTETSFGPEKEKEICKKSAKELKNLFSNQRKTIYFVYEKIEKDETSGKKVFVGNFRTKEEVEALSKEKSSHLDIKSIESSENKEERNIFLIPNSSNQTDSEQSFPFQGELELKKESSFASGTSFQSKTKHSLTLQRPMAKSSNLKKEQINVAVGKVVNELNQNSQNFRRLIDLIGLDKRKKPKAFIYELQETSGVSGTSTEVGKKNKNLPTVQEYIAQSSLSLMRKRQLRSPRYGSPSEGNQRNVNERVSQSALIIIPVEVDSLSKVEVILIQHSNSVKDCSKMKEKEIIPCLNYCK